MMKLIVATTNHNKLDEIRKILLGEMKIETFSLGDLEDVPEIIEDCETFEGNALKKAKIIYEKYRIPTVADDSGIVIDALDGAPGVMSARYAGEGATAEELTTKVLEEMTPVLDPYRGARFVCSMAYVDGSTENVFEGVVDGRILNVPRGFNGFGYDSIFYYGPYRKTFAEMSQREKNSVSHRGRALNSLKKLLVKKYTMS